MDEDSTWNFNAPQHYCDLPSAITHDDSEQADQYFFAKADDTVYYDYEGHDNDGTTEWKQEISEIKEEHPEQYPVIRRRSRSVGSRPLFLKKSSAPKTMNSNPNLFKKPLQPKSSRPKSVEDPDHYFVEGLRAYNPVKGHEVPKVTKPVPFNLTMPKKRITQTVSANPSMAEGVQKWEKKTPERFHSTRAGEVFKCERVEMKSTEPHTPQLMAVKRHRPVHALSREEREKLEVEEMKKHQFKAHTVDEKVFKAPVLPCKKEVKLTKVEPFHLSECNKKENIPPQNDEPDFQFHAKPVPKFDPPPVVERKPTSVTIPQTPKFSEAGKASLQMWRRQRSRSNGSLGTGRTSSSGSLCSSTNERMKNTVVEPFSFEDRDKRLQRKRELKIKQALEEERKQREFHANPCPNFSHPSIPERPTLTTTRPAPFHLSCETRGVSKKEKFLQQLEEMRLEERKATQFKAQPAKSLVKEPFKVRLDISRNQTTDVAEFNLSTQRRAAERKNFDQYLKEREQEKEANRMMREQERLQKEAEEIARLREETKFSANPIRHFKSIEIKRADAELLTIPKTPKFMKK